MIRLNACIFGNVQRVGYSRKLITQAETLGITGFVQNRPDGSVLVIAEGKRDPVEKFESILVIRNSVINVERVEAHYFNGASGEYTSFRKITGPDEIGERLDDGIEILKGLLADLNAQIAIMQSNFDGLGFKRDKMLDKRGQMRSNQYLMQIKRDYMIDMQDETADEREGSGRDKKRSFEQRIESIEQDLALIKAALKEKGIIV